MIQKISKLMAVLLVCCAALCLFSCSGNDKKEATSDASLAVEAGDSLSEGTFDVSDYDLMYFANGSLNFYRLSDSTTSVYKGEKDLIMSYCFQPNTLMLYYSVCTKDSTVAVKKVDMSKANPEPEDVVDFGLKYKQCVSETYEGYSPLFVNNDASMIVLEYDFSWDSYDFCRMKAYLPKTGKFQKDFTWDMFYSDNGNDTDDGFGNISFSSRPGDQDPDDENEEDTDLGLYFFCMDNNELQPYCISDKIDFVKLNVEEHSFPEEFDACSLSPDKKYVLYYATLYWGDYPHGPYCVASLDGEYQFAIEETDISQTSAISWLDDGQLLYVGEEPRPKTDPDYDEYNTTRSCIKILPAGSKAPEVLIHEASDFVIMKSGK